MIRFTNIRNLSKREDNQWVIVRSMKDIPAWMIHVPQLSPSKKLFFKYIELEKRGMWNEEAFKNIYVPWFLSDLKRNHDGSRDKLNMLYKMDKAGISVTAGCFCTDETMCHRSICAGLLQGAGCNVATDSGMDFTMYYDMYRKL